MPAPMSLVEPIKLKRFQPIYKAYVPVPIDVSGILLDDATLVVVRAFFQGDGDDDDESQWFPLHPDPLKVGLWSSIKQAPGDVPTLAFIPPVPGVYTVVLIGVTKPALVAWRTDPIAVTP